MNDRRFDIFGGVAFTPTFNFIFKKELSIQLTELQARQADATQSAKDFKKQPSSSQKEKGT